MDAYKGPHLHVTFTIPATDDIDGLLADMDLTWGESSVEDALTDGVEGFEPTLRDAVNEIIKDWYRNVLDPVKVEDIDIRVVIPEED